MSINERANALLATRARVWEEAKGFLSDLKGEEMSSEQRIQWDRYNERLDTLKNEVDELIAREDNEREAGQLREAQGRAFGVDPDVRSERKDINAQLRAWIRGEDRNEFVDDEGRRVNGWQVNLDAVRRERDLLRQGASADEIRALAWDTGSVASAVPTLFDRSLYEILEANIAAFRLPTRRIPTASGAPMDFPKTAALGLATQVAGQGTALAGTDPSFAKITLTPRKFGQLVKVATEVVTDSGVDIVSFVAGDIGRAVGRKINEALVTGTGVTGGLMSSVTVGAAGTVATGGSLIGPSYNTLVDVVYSINDGYRSQNSVAWLFRDSTAGVIRKLRDGAGGTEGAPLWQPSTQTGIAGQRQPDMLLGYPVFTDPNVASMASNARIATFGDWSAYYLRTVGNLIVERNDSVGFDTDQVHFRGKWRADGAFADLTAVNLLKQSV